MKKENLKRYFLAWTFFMTGFLLSILDFEVLKFLEEFISTYNEISIFIFYIIFTLFFYFSAKKTLLLSKELLYKINNNTLYKKDYIYIFFYSYFLGFVVNIGNALILVFFNKFIFNFTGGSYVF